MAAWVKWSWLFLWGILLRTAFCQKHRGYFLLRVVPVNNPNGRFKAGDNFIITAPAVPSQPLIVRQNPPVKCEAKPTALYLPSSIWLADWRIPASSSLTPSSTSTSAFSFFTRAKIALDDISTPLLRSLSARTRSLVWGYLNTDEGTAKEGRVELLEVPDGSRSTEGYKPGAMLVDVDGLGTAESARFLYDPIDPSAGSPNLKPNLTPPKSDSWVTGTFDPSIKDGKAYFTVCEPTTADAGTYHLFRVGVTPQTRSENFFSLFYSSCEEVFILAERVLDDSICFQWDMGRERDYDAISELGAKRLFTLYHNSISPSAPIVISPEIDGPSLQSLDIGPDINNNDLISLDQNPKNFNVPSTRKTSQASNPERTISSITAIEDLLTDEYADDNTSFTEGLRDFMDVRRDTPDFGSTQNSESGSKEGMNLPDEINILPSNAGVNMITPSPLADRVSIARELPRIQRGSKGRLTVPTEILDGSPIKKDTHRVQGYDVSYPTTPTAEPMQQQPEQGGVLERNSGSDGSGILRPRPQVLITSNPFSNINKFRSKGSLPFLVKPREPGYMPLSEVEKKRGSLVLPELGSGRTGRIPSTNNNLLGLVDRTMNRPSKGYQTIPGVNINSLLPITQWNQVRTTPRLESDNYMRFLPLKEMEEEDLAIVETPGFSSKRKPTMRSSPMDMYVSDNGFPVVMNRDTRPSIEKGMISGLNAGDWKRPSKGYSDMVLPEELKAQSKSRMGTGIGRSVPASPKGLQGPSPNINTRVGTPRDTNHGFQQIGSRTMSTRNPSLQQAAVQGNRKLSQGGTAPRPRTPSPSSPGVRSTSKGGKPPPSPIITVGAFDKKVDTVPNGERKVREKVKVVDYKKIIEERKRKSTVPKFKSSKDFVKWLKENRGGNTDTNSPDQERAMGNKRTLVEATPMVKTDG